MIKTTAHHHECASTLVGCSLEIENENFDSNNNSSHDLNNNLNFKKISENNTNCKRIVLKNGNVNFESENINLRRAFVRDMFTTMIDIQWRWNILVFLLGFFGSWFIFALLWWLMAYIHLDLENHSNNDWRPCVVNMNTFMGALLFSLESQHTIGYGFRYISDQCPDAFLLLCLQSITGVIIQGFVVGFVFAKLTRPQCRSETLIFSKNAIIGIKNGSYCLSFRVGDLRNRSNIIGAKITAVFVERKLTKEGQILSCFHEKLPLTFDGMGNELFLLWPSVISHIIDHKSPLKDMTKEKLKQQKFEIVIVLEGTIESTGQLVQARTSYLATEILWDYCFDKIIQYNNHSAHFCVDYSKFNSVKQITNI